MDLIRVTIILSFLITIIIGLVAGKKAKGKPDNYMVGGRSWPAYLVGLALLAQAIDGNATMGNTSLSYDFGFWAGASLPIGLAISLFLFGKFFAHRLNAFKLTTMSDLFERKFDMKIGFIASIILLFGFGILLAGNIAAIGILIKLFFPIKYETAVIITVLVVLLYSFRGGIVSDIYSDIFQIALVGIGILGAFFFLTLQYGFINFGSLFTFDKFSLNQLIAVKDGALINWATIVALGFGNLVAIDFGQRIFAAKSPQAAKRGCYLGGLLTLLFGLPFSFIIFYFIKLNLQSTPDTPVIINFGLQNLPVFAGALLIAGVINAALSTIDGAILSMGNILSRNLLRIKSNENDNNPQLENTVLYFLRISLLPITFAAMIFALLLPSPGALLSIAFDITFAALLVPFVFAFSSKYNDAKAALYAIIFGGISRIIFATLTPTLFGLPNPLYIKNNFVDPSLDGLGTMIAPLIALVVYLLMLNKSKRYVTK